MLIVAVQACKRNIKLNGSAADAKVQAVHSDARIYMMTHEKQFDAVCAKCLISFCYPNYSTKLLIISVLIFFMLKNICNLGYIVKNQKRIKVKGLLGWVFIINPRTQKLMPSGF